MSFYLTQSAGKGFFPVLQQGDIIEKVIFPAPSVVKAAVADVASKSVAEIDLSAPSGPSAGQVVLEFRVFVGVVVCQTCDLERGNKPIILAPAVSYLSKFPATDMKADGFKSKWAVLDNPGKHPTTFPLPPCSAGSFSLPCSLVDLSTMQSFQPDQLPYFNKSVVLRMSPHALAKFQERVAFCFGRYAAPEGLFNFA